MFWSEAEGEPGRAPRRRMVECDGNDPRAKIEPERTGGCVETGDLAPLYLFLSIFLSSPIPYYQFIYLFYFLLAPNLVLFSSRLCSLVERIELCIV